MYHRGSGMKISDWVLLRLSVAAHSLAQPDPLEQ